MIITLENQYTHNKEPYLLEVTRNVDQFMDAFRFFFLSFSLFDSSFSYHPSSGKTSEWEPICFD